MKKENGWKEGQKYKPSGIFIGCFKVLLDRADESLNDRL